MKINNYNNMKKFIQPLIVVLLLVAGTSNVFAEKFHAKSPSKDKGTNAPKGTMAAGCAQASAYEFLETNNVRARFNTGGDMWWNMTGDAAYFIPGSTTKTSLFATALWIGGLDVTGQLKLAAQRFRQDGIDFWTGPLTAYNQAAAVTPDVCAAYDKMFRITKAEVQEFIGWFSSTNKDEEYPEYSIPKSITEWPAHPYDAPGAATYLAPFFDFNGDGQYNPENGDYPYYDFDNELCPLNYAGDPSWKPQGTMGSTGTPFDDNVTEIGGIQSDQVIHGDETLWWVFNDKGGAHTETNGVPIGLEIRAHAFAFATNDEINNMSFLSYEIINRSVFKLTETYFGVWVDPDLGFGGDDYLGCDVARGMGYCYNGNDIDGSGEPQAYGAHPPAVGIDFFQGPYMDADGYDNPGFRHDPLKGPSFHNYKPNGPTGVFQNECEIVTSHNKIMRMSYGLNAANYIYDSINIPTLVRAEAINGVNFGNGIVDDERFGMRRFVYFNNDQDPIYGDPDPVAAQYYNFLRGIWKDNARIVYGGAGHPSSPDAQASLFADFVFPYDSDPCNWGTGGEQPQNYNNGERFWNEVTAGNDPKDRRMIQSAGPFTLLPGAVNYITVGVPWARTNNGTPWESVLELRLVDDKCQALFENCFKVIDGPDAPELTFVELDRKLICIINNPKTSNNYLERYAEVDNTISKGDSLFRFEGYQIYQVIDENVGPEELNNTDKARLIAQYDIANGIGRIINFELDDYLGFDVPVEKVAGADLGITHTFEITTDQFPIGNDNQLINNRNYYFVGIAYAYNNFRQFSPDSAYVGGQKEPYLSGRKAADGTNIKPVAVMPHKTLNGMVLNSAYGDIPQITRLEGKGNGGININLTKETINEILSKPLASETNTYGMETYPMVYKTVYEVGAGPISVKVIDPLSVKGSDYKLRFVDCEEETVKFKGAYQQNDPVKYISYAKWELLDEYGNVVDTAHNAITISKSDTSIANSTAMFFTTSYEQILPDRGISIHIDQVMHPGDFYSAQTSNNGMIESTGTYADSSRQWLSGFIDVDEPESPTNWIRSGTQASRTDCGGGTCPVIFEKSDYDMERDNPWDPYQVFEKIQGGSWAPQALSAAIKDPGQITSSSIDVNVSYAPNFTYKVFGPLLEINSVDIVLTPDKSLWTRALVIEECWDTALAENGCQRFYTRKAKSIDKNGNKTPEGVTAASNNPEDPNYLSADGMGWFPGYAINIETGERLNIMYGENSYFAANNGRDMIFNPTPNFMDDHGSWVFGGMHYVYVMGSKHIRNQLPSGGPLIDMTFPAYDGCLTIKNFIEELRSLPWIQGGYYQRNYLDMVYGSCMYIGQPCPSGFAPWLDNEFKLRIRVKKPYERYFAQAISEDVYPSENGHWPLYSFTTKGLEPTINDISKLENDLDLINVVPNPYYAYAGYESGATDNRIRFTNLPDDCTITIYNMGGTMVRQFKKATSAVTYVDWDLKNFAGVPIAGGVYLIHIRTRCEDGQTRDRVIKWFGVIRTVDLFTF